jgi:cation diffusion facilitator CzcD-associated flavoprotein CzcO
LTCSALEGVECAQVVTEVVVSASSSAASGRPLRFIVIGAGLSGVLSAVKLALAGFTDVTLFEKAERLGGTWRDNTYPGVACDVPSHLYSYSFELNPRWSRRCSPGGEILAYLEDVARRYGIDKRIRYSFEVSRCEFANGRWNLETTRGHRDTADVIIAATGVMHHPKMPDIAGLDCFAGAQFHSARWNHSVPLDGRRVGIIGTGSTAIQLVPALVDRVARLTLFQRTPQWIMPQETHLFSADEQARFHADPQLMRSMRGEIQRIVEESFADAVVDASSAALAALERACRQHLNQVADPELREKLRPRERVACKRLVWSPDFYQAIQKPNAALISQGIEAVEPAGVRTRDGQLHELDVLALATGFQVDRFVRPAEVIGRNGERLSERWAQRPSAYLSVAVPSFPNFFMLNGPNGPVGNHSLIEVAELQMHYILQLIELLRTGACREISPTERSAAEREAARSEATRNTVWASGCRSWYLDARGIPAAWPWKFERFRAEMAAPKLEDYELVP